MAKRYFITEVDQYGGEWNAGNRRGYPTAEAALKAARRLAKQVGRTHCVALYEVAGDDKDCIEIIGYEHPSGYDPDGSRG